MSKLKVSFYLKKDKKKNQKVAIYTKISLGGTTSTMSTGKYINPSRWKKTNMLLQAKRNQHEISLKNYIYDIPTRITDIYMNLRKEGHKSVTAIELKNFYLGKSSNKPKITLIQLIKIHNTNFVKRVEKGEVSINTLEKYQRVQKIMNEFLMERYKLKDIAFHDIDNKFIYDFDDYLRYERPNGSTKGIGNNTTVKYFSNIKTMLNYCKRRDYINHNPFKAYEKKLEDVETVFLTQLELEEIESLKFESYRLDTVRDIFLFSCYTSYAPVDAMKLTWDNVQKDVDGEYWIRTRRQKSKVKSDIIILPPVMRIIKKYKNDPRCTEDARLLPKYWNQKMNESLKLIADLAGIKKKLCWYVGRHTFATTVCLSNTIPLEHVSKMMGHKKITQTQHYAKLLDHMVKHEIEKLKKIYSK